MGFELQKEHLDSIEKKIETSEKVDIPDSKLDAKIEDRIQKLSNFAINSDYEKVQSFYEAVNQTAQEFDLSPNELLTKIYSVMGDDSETMEQNFKAFGIKPESVKDGVIEPLENSTLTILREFGYDNLYFSKNSQHGNIYYDFGNINNSPEILRKLQNPDIKHVYEKLINVWGFEQIPFNEFSDLIENQEKMDFFSESKNLPKIKQIISLYGFKPKRGKDGDSYVSFEHYNYDAERFNDILKNFDKLTDISNKEFLEKFFTIYEGDGYLTVMDLSIISSDRILNNFETAKTISQILLNEYEIDDTTVSYSFKYFSDENANEVLAFLNNPEIREAYLSTKDAYLINGDIANHLPLISVFYNLRNIPSLKTTVNNLVKINFIFSRENVENLANLLVRDDLADVISQDDFVGFAEKFKFVFPEQNFFDEITEIAKLYKMIKANPSLESIIFSTDYSDVVKFLLENFEIQIHRLNFSVVVRIVEHFEDFLKLLDFLRKNGEIISEGDFTMVIEMIENPSLVDLYNDREKMEKKILDQVYSKTMVERNDKYFKSMNISERPDLKTINSLNLLRMCIISDGLLTESMNNSLKTMINLDLEEVNSEIGGEIVFDNSGNIVLNKDYYYRNYNGSFSTAESAYFREGISVFHNHLTVTVKDFLDYTKGLSEEQKLRIIKKLSDSGFLDEQGRVQNWNESALRDIATTSLGDSKQLDKDVDQVVKDLRKSYEFDLSGFAGPSGSLSVKSDFTYQEKIGGGGTVFTAVGYVKNEDGSLDRSKLQVDVDFYYIDETDPENLKPVVVDLGVIVVAI